MLEFDLSATAADGANQQTRTFGGMRGNCLQMGMEYFDKLELLAQSQKIGEQAIELLDADECPTGEMDLVIASDQMMLQIHESVGHALEVDRILGDERNYAGWSFVNLEDFGKLQYGSKLMNITANVKFDIYGLNNIQPVWADNYFKAISNSKMGLNLSRGEPIKYYSSDRITQIIGNGLVTLIDEKHIT